jgi:hypothetical protein
MSAIISDVSSPIKTGNKRGLGLQDFSCVNQDHISSKTCHIKNNELILEQRTKQHKNSVQKSDLLDIKKYSSEGGI